MHCIRFPRTPYIPCFDWMLPSVMFPSAPSSPFIVGVEVSVATRAVGVATESVGVVTESVGVAT